jgi:hypothetical protein
LAGCTLKAIRLAREIEYCFDIPVRFKEGHDGLFEVVWNGKEIYSKVGACDPHESNEPIFSAISRFKQPLRSPHLNLSNRVSEKDPDYLEWLRSVCSGE